MRFPVINMQQDIYVCVYYAYSLGKQQIGIYAVDINYYYALRQALVSLHINIYCKVENIKMLIALCTKNYNLT